MIYQLTGKIARTSESFAVIDVAGVGYGVNVPRRLVGNPIITGQQITILTITIVRQDDISLYGFTSNIDREFFLMLLKIPGIGPKGALKILSSMSSVKIMQAILSGDKKALAKFPGVGPKTSQRLIVELQEKVKALLDDSEVEYEDPLDEAVDVLTGLGCDYDEARDVLAKVKNSAGDKEMSFDDLLNESLRVMAEIDF